MRAETNGSNKNDVLPGCQRPTVQGLCIIPGLNLKIALDSLLE